MVAKESNEERRLPENQETRYKYEAAKKMLSQKSSHFMNYQPVYEYINGIYKFHHFEALFRTDQNLNIEHLPQHIEGIIDVAMKGKLIHDITFRVFTLVCNDLMLLKENYSLNNENLPKIAFNVTIDFFFNDDLKYILKMLSNAHIPLSKIGLEISEKSQVNNSDLNKVLKNIELASKNNISVYLDDCGSGKHIDLSYIKKFAEKGAILKLDRTFALKAQYYLETLNEYLKMCPNLIVEGVDNPILIKYLTENGVKFFQNYELGRPAPLNDFYQLKRNLQ